MVGAILYPGAVGLRMICKDMVHLHEFRSLLKQITGLKLVSDVILMLACSLLNRRLGEHLLLRFLKAALKAALTRMRSPP